MYATRALDASSWELFAELVERNNGVYGGCWCIAMHADRPPGPDHRETKHQLVRDDRAHAALVLDEEGRAQGWAQYGSVAELDIRHRRVYEKDAPPRPDWRISCVFVDKGHRHQGVARAAVGGALQLIARAGGGLVEAISETTAGRTAQARFLFSATAELFEDVDFVRDRQVGKHAWVLSRHVLPDRGTAQQEAAMTRSSQSTRS